MGGYHLPGAGGVVDQEARLLDILVTIASEHAAITAEASRDRTHSNDQPQGA
jgi:hypothetical protein